MNLYKLHSNPKKLNLYNELSDVIMTDEGFVKFGKFEKLGFTLHRDDDKPSFIAFNPIQLTWFKNGKMHRDGDNPSMITDAGLYWHKHGDLHRDDGPAVISKNGVCKYYWSGAFVKSEYISQEEAKKLIDYYTKEAKSKK